jgi:uncharacterized membrane protein
MEWVAHHLPLILFAVLAIALFCGYPVAFVLGGIAILFGAIGMLLDVFHPVQFFNLLPRIWACGLESTRRADVHLHAPCWSAAASPTTCCTACRCCCAVFLAVWRCRSR